MACWWVVVNVQQTAHVTCFGEAVDQPIVLRSSHAIINPSESGFLPVIHMTPSEAVIPIVDNRMCVH